MEENDILLIDVAKAYDCNLITFNGNIVFDNISETKVDKIDWYSEKVLEEFTWRLTEDGYQVLVCKGHEK